MHWLHSYILQVNTACNSTLNLHELENNVHWSSEMWSVRHSGGWVCAVRSQKYALAIVFLSCTRLVFWLRWVDSLPAVESIFSAPSAVSFFFTFRYVAPGGAHLRLAVIWRTQHLLWSFSSSNMYLHGLLGKIITIKNPFLNNQCHPW
jgi:hypothetical protein